MSRCRRLLAPLLLLTLTLMLPVGQAAQFEHVVQLHEYGGGGMHLSPEQINAKVGDELVFHVENPSVNPSRHNLVVCGEAPHPESTCQTVWAKTKMLASGEKETIRFTLTEAGTFEYFCDIIGHKTATPGMRGVLIVKGEEPKQETPAPALPAALAVLALSAILLRRK